MTTRESDSGRWTWLRGILGLAKWLAMASLLGWGSWAGAVLLDNATGRQAVQAAMLLDPTGQRTLAEVQAADAGFEAPSSRFTLGYRAGHVWLRFTLQRPAASSEPWWLELSSPLADEVRLYALRADGSVVEQVDGDEQPHVQRALDHRHPVFRLDLAPDAPQTYYLRIRSRNALAFDLTAWQAAPLLAGAVKSSLLFGLFASVHLTMALVALASYGAGRRPLMLNFALYAITALASLGGVSGLLQQWVYPGVSGRLNDWLVAGALMSSVPMFLQFAFGTLGLEGRIQTWARRSLVLVWVVSLISVSAIAVSFDVFQPVLRGYQWVMMSAAIGLALLVGQQAVRGHQTARILVVAFMLLVLGIALRALQNTGHLDSGVLGEYGAHLGSTLCMVAMAYAADFQLRSVVRLKALQLDHDLETSRLAERELERRVLQRTESLHRALGEREEALNVQLRAQQEQRQFIATLSHELRTPLAIVDATVQNLVLRHDQNSGVQLSFDKIQRAATRMALLLDDQLDEVRFRAFGDGLKLRDIDLGELLEDVANAGRQIGHQHLLSVSVPGLSSLVQVDPDRLGQALRNLLDNAVKYTPPGTEIVLSARQLENGFEIDVTDQGPGPREEELPFLFDRWFRGRGAVGQPGTGLGLALVRDLMRQMGGSVTLATGPGGIGCIARLWLPSQGSESAQDQQSVSGALKL